MSDHTKLVKTLYFPILQSGTYTGIRGILYEVGGVLVDIDSITDEYFEEMVGYSKSDLMDMIANELYLDFFKE